MRSRSKWRETEDVIRRRAGRRDELRGPQKQEHPVSPEMTTALWEIVKNHGAPGVKRGPVEPQRTPIPKIDIRIRALHRLDRIRQKREAVSMRYDREIFSDGFIWQVLKHFLGDQEVSAR